MTAVASTSYEDRKPGEEFVLSDEEKRETPNGENYEYFTVEGEPGEKFAVPVRRGIVGDYTEFGYGYLIQQTAEGFRFIGVEAGEEDAFGSFLPTRKAAIRAADANWKHYGGSNSWGEWSRRLERDAVAPDVKGITPEALEAFFVQAEAAKNLTPAEIDALVKGIVELLPAAD